MYSTLTEQQRPEPDGRDAAGDGAGAAPSLSVVEAQGFVLTEVLAWGGVVVWGGALVLLVVTGLKRRRKREHDA